MARMGASAAAVLLMVAGLMAIRPGESEVARALTNCTVPTGDELLNAQEQQMLAAVNQERTSRGIPALKPSPSLNRAAAWKSLDSSAVPPGISHTDSLGRSPSKRGQDCGYGGLVAENIAYGFFSAESTLEAFMESTGHRGNILNPSYVVIGIGVGQGTAWTLDFGVYDDSAIVPSPTPTRTPTRTATAPPPSPTLAAPSPTPTTASTFSMHLADGANFVTYLGPARNVAQVTASLGSALVGVYHWDSAGGRWERYAAGAPAYVSNFSSMRTGEVYAILLFRPATWTY